MKQSPLNTSYFGCDPSSFFGDARIRRRPRARDERRGDLLDAAGFDIVLVETVGVGQDEVEVIRTVQSNVVVLVPGMGDDIQAIKAGIMEIADIFAVNKADRPGADRTVTEVTMMMSLVDEHAEWVPPIVKTVASQAKRIAELDAELERHRDFLLTSGEMTKRRRERVRIRVENHLEERFMDRLLGGTWTPEEYNRILDDILEKRANPHGAAASILGALRTGRQPGGGRSRYAAGFLFRGSEVECPNESHHCPGRWRPDPTPGGRTGWNRRRGSSSGRRRVSPYGGG